MSNEEKFPMVLTVCISAIVLGIAWAISWAYVNSWRTLTEQGYVEQQMQGSSATIWVKPDKTNKIPSGVGSTTRDVP